MDMSSHVCLLQSLKYVCHVPMGVFSVTSIFSKNFSFLCILWLYIKEYAFISIGAIILCADPFLMISCFSLSFEFPILGVAKATIRIKWRGLWKRHHYFSLKHSVRAIDHKGEPWQGSVITITRLITNLHGWILSTGCLPCYPVCHCSTVSV